MNVLASSILAALTAFTPPAEPCLKNCHISPVGIALIQHYEGFEPYVYRDVVGIRTIGYGHVVLPGETFDEPLTGEEAEQLLLKDIAKHQAAVNRLVNRPLWALQADALISWTLNLGWGRLASSTMLKRVNARRDAEVPPEMRKWVYAGDRKWLGLVLRRDAEAFLYDRAKP